MTVVNQSSLETVVISDDEIPVSSQHTGYEWTEERLDAAFAERAEDLRRWLA